jgi:hypothetical protein
MKLGEIPKTAIRAQALFLALQPFVDDQGRLEADPRLVKIRVAGGLAISEKQMSAALEAIDQVGLGRLYEASGQRILQLIDWREWNNNLRYHEPSDLPPPTGWTDRVNSWQDDPKMRGSRAQKERKAKENTAAGEVSAAEDRRSAVTSLKLKSKEQVETKNNVLSTSSANDAQSPLEARPKTSLIPYTILGYVDQGLINNKVCRQEEILPHTDRAKREAALVEEWLNLGIDSKWLSAKLVDLARRATKPVFSLNFFRVNVLDDWQAEKGRRAESRRSSNG